MTTQRVLSRRAVLASGAAIGAAGSILAQESAHAGTAAPGRGNGAYLNATDAGVVPGLGKDQGAALQAALDRAVERGLGLLLPPGRVVASNVVLRAGAVLAGSGRSSVLVYGGGGTMFRGAGADGVTLRDFAIDGAERPLDRARARALVDLETTRGVSIDGLSVTGSAGDGLALSGCSGRITRTLVDGVADAGIFSLDADLASGSVAISDVQVRNCRDNGILIWRSVKGDDGSRVTNATIALIGNKSGGSGQFGNGVNVFRAGGVAVTGCHITQCAYSAVRGNAADNIRMIGNGIADIGEVALYAEFGFSGAVIANNVVDGAATGIAVTNFDHGGRLAVVQGNLVRNLRRRDHEPVDKRGEGIAVEADAAVSGNVVEGAPSIGILIGWGKHMRDVAATGNIVRDCGVGIGVSVSVDAGRVLVANNVVSGSRHGAIVAMDHDNRIGVLSERDAANENVRLSGNIAS
ncbi:MAG TPA: TIGR03808 family TAT-translocated repetitive protein [Hyphomicrobiaceae bacterium]|nr:TIGR03808 family TAT-translocated repetitive protein [Hyphomicrobiaceae bacterium]